MGAGKGISGSLGGKLLPTVRSNLRGTLQTCLAGSLYVEGVSPGWEGASVLSDGGREAAREERT